MHKFGYSLLYNGMLPAGLQNISTDIYSLRAMSWGREDQFVDIYTALAAIAKVQSVKSPNEIEGIVTTDQRINEIVNRNSAPLNHTEQEIAGYRDARAVVHAGYADMDFRLADILRLHAIMLNISGYPADTSDEMDQLVLAYREARDNPNINRLLLIPCVILDFLCIHPFRGGNGRMSKLLSLLLLYRNGFDAGKYIPIQQKIQSVTVH